MGGQYQSRTGLGKGILGTKRLADSFHIATSDEGTSITAAVTL
jgi:serine/threonine-protein kinase RsbT